jgi:hypothetical protein
MFNKIVMSPLIRDRHEYERLAAEAIFLRHLVSDQKMYVGMMIY